MSIVERNISPAQFTGILISTVLPTALLFVPAVTVEIAGRDGWMTELIALFYGVAVVMVATSLGLRFPDKTVYEYSCDILGKYFGKVVGLVYLFFFVESTAVIVREFGDFIVVSYMPRTPAVVFIGIIVLLAAYAVRSGFEVIARMNQFVLLLTMVSIAGIFGLVIQEFHPEHLLPVLENGIKPVLRGGFTPSAWRGEVFILLMFIPFLNKFKAARAAALKSVLILTVILLLDIVICIGVFEVQVAQFVFPVYYLAYYAGVAGFIERIESVVLALWVSGVTVKVAIWYYAAVLGVTQVFGLKDYKPVVFPLGLIIGVMALFAFSSSAEISQYFAGEFPFYAFTFEIVIPLGLLITAVLRKKNSLQQKGGKAG